MKLEKDFEDFIKLLNKHDVQYVIVGAYAVSFYARPRNTGDIDFFVNNLKSNINKLIKVIREFGFQDFDMEPSYFENDNSILQLGYEPVRIDILTGISGVTFDQVYKNSESGMLGKQEVEFISLSDLIKNKRATGRTKDQSDVEVLLKFQDS